jgi:peptide/nickel transport system ATP-binding protein
VTKAVSNAGDSLVEIENLTITYSTPRGEIRAVDGVSLAINKGEILGLVGESGCGKSTLALSLLRKLPTNGRVLLGSIRVASVDIGKLNGEELRRFRWKKVAMIFQSAMNALDPVKTIEAQMMETIRQHEKITKDEARRRIHDLLRMVDLNPEIAGSYAHQLSGGMRQRTVIAMALCLNPDLLLADEPTTALDVVVQAGILRTLKRLQDKLGLTVILISHDISIMWSMTNRIAVMYAGEIVEVGETKQIIKAAQHPYTEALLHSVPVLGKKQLRIKAIGGTPPDLLFPIVGCRFASRCPYVFERCRVEKPPLMDLGGRSLAACWLKEEKRNETIGSPM